MTIHPIDEKSLMLHLTPADLQPFHLSPQDLTPNFALQMALDAFSSLGIHIKNQVSLEIYPDPFGALIFAQVISTPLTWFAFYSFHDLATTLLPLSDHLKQGEITYYDGTYFLSVPSDQSQSIHLISQFSVPLSTQPDFSLHTSCTEKISFNPTILLAFPGF